MKVAFFEVHGFERAYFAAEAARQSQDLTFIEARLFDQTVGLASGHDCVCAFVNDRLDRPVLTRLKEIGIKLIALRSAGFNHVDLRAAVELGLTVVRVPEYSPHAVAEHAVALILTLNRKIHRAYARVREGNFSLDGLVGFDLFGKTVGVVGAGRIGSVMARIMAGFGCKVLVFDQNPSAELSGHPGIRFAGWDELIESSDILSLHLPLTPTTHHILNGQAISRMKKGAMLINTGRGALIDTAALVAALKSGQIGAAGLDVYEEEEGVFFEDLSAQVLQDDTLARLLTFPNVILTSHQAFLTRDALKEIARVTMQNIWDFERGHPLENKIDAGKAYGG